MLTDTLDRDDASAEQDELEAIWQQRLVQLNALWARMQLMDALRCDPQPGEFAAAAHADSCLEGREHWDSFRATAGQIGELLEPKQTGAVAGGAGDEPEWEGEFEWDLDLAEEVGLDRVLERYEADSRVARMPSGEQVTVVTVSGQTDDFGREKVFVRFDDELTDVHDWLDRMSYEDMRRYARGPEPNEELWTEKYALYHGTRPELVESILEHGLEPRNHTRGMTNRHTGAAVFCHPRSGWCAYSYGEHVIRIDIAAMAADGFTPEAHMEEPVRDAEHRRAIAYALDLYDYEDPNLDSSDGLDPDTRIFYEPIPPKYLSVVPADELLDDGGW